MLANDLMLGWKKPKSIEAGDDDDDNEQPTEMAEEAAANVGKEL